MSKIQNNFTPEQWAVINESITAAKKDIVDTVQRKVVEVINTNQQQILESIKHDINAVINANQKVIIATGQNVTTQETPTDAKNEATKNWKVFVVVLPIILSTALGLMVWRAQTKIQSDISNSSAHLQSRLETGSALTQEFYKKRLEIYDETHKKMALLVDALQSARINRESVGVASDSLKSLNQTYRINNLYVSNEVAKELQQLWRLGIDMPSLRPSGKTTMNEILTQISRVEEQMKSDLGVKSLGEITKIVSPASSQ